MLSWYDDKVQIRFLAEQQKTADLVSSELGYFQDILSEQGLSFEELTVEQTLLDDMNIHFSRDK